MLLGVCLGDALGSPCEFGSPPVSSYTGTFHAGWTLKHTNRYGYTVIHQAGQVTDDSEMTASLLAVVASGEYSKEKAVRAYHDFVNSGTHSIGKNTRILFHGYKCVANYDKRYATAFDTRSKREAAQSNGHLMRVSPLALINDQEDRDRFVEIDTSITNPSRICVAAAKIYVSVLRLAFERNRTQATEPTVTQMAIRKCVEMRAKG